MRKFLPAFLILIVSLTHAQNPVYYVLVGTYTNTGKSEGIYVYRFNPNKGEATFVSKTTGIENPSYLTVSKNQKYVYAVNEVHGDASGQVSAFNFDKTKGELHFLNKQPSGGDDPCYVSIDSSGKFVTAANYGGGNFSVLQTNDDGLLKPYTQLVAHEGYGVNVKRQEMPHVHCTVFSPDQKYLFTADLGNDKLYHYNFTPSNFANPITPMDPPYYEIPDGSGPRHITFHPNEKFAYLINELAGNVFVYQYNNGQLTQIQTIESDNTKTKDDKASSEIDITPDGKFLYTSNRGINDVTIYKVQTDGRLLEVGHQPVGLKPRFITVDPTGHFLFVANQDSNNIQIFVINKNYGLLQDTGVKIDVGQPACIKFIPVK